MAALAARAQRAEARLKVLDEARQVDSSATSASGSGSPATRPSSVNGAVSGVEPMSPMVVADENHSPMLPQTKVRPSFLSILLLYALRLIETTRHRFILSLGSTSIKSRSALNLPRLHAVLSIPTLLLLRNHRNNRMGTGITVDRTIRTTSSVAVERRIGDDPLSTKSVRPLLLPPRTPPSSSILVRYHLEMRMKRC